MSAAPLLLGVDLGGTKIEAAALRADGSMVLRRRRPTPQGDYDATLRAIAALAAEVAAEAGLPAGEARRVGVAIPGSVSPASGLIRNANSTVLNDRPLQRDLEAALGCPVRLSNDANCLAVSEAAADGAGADAAMVFGVILGTGVGGGIALHGRPWLGRNAVAGEWGHNPLPWRRGAPAWGEADPPACWCGQRGCIESWLSGPGFAADFARAGGQGDAAAIVAAMRASDVAARAAFIRYCDRLARALAHVINVLDPEVIVLGGGMSNVDEIYDEVPRRWGAWVFSDVVATPLRRARHGDSSGVRGAAWLWREAPAG